MHTNQDYLNPVVYSLSTYYPSQGWICIAIRCYLLYVQIARNPNPNTDPNPNPVPNPNPNRDCNHNLHPNPNIDPNPNPNPTLLYQITLTLWARMENSNP